MAIGYLALVLHAHLPYVRHPESDYVLEEEWLYEAIIETYVPLLTMFDGLKRDGVDFKLTMSMTPPLVSMLRDPLLQERFDAHLAQLEELAELEVERHAHNGHLRYLAETYAQEFNHVRNTWENYSGDLVTAFKQYQDSNNLEIITCGATHGYLPLMKMYPEAVWAQIQVAAEHYEVRPSPPSLWQLCADLHRNWGRGFRTGSRILATGLVVPGGLSRCARIPRVLPRPGLGCGV
jgi:1,4-alpha-glucan branching enzyme